MNSRDILNARRRRPFRAATPAVLVLLAAVFELGACGWIRADLKFVGDACLAAALVTCLARPTPQRSAAERFQERAILGFLALAVALGIYSVLRYGEPILVLKQGRRWIIAGMYYLLATTYLKDQLDRRVIRFGVMALTTLAFLAVIALQRGILSQYGNGPDALFAEYEQGGVLVFKPFVPGVLFFYLLAACAGVGMVGKAKSPQTVTLYLVLFSASLAIAIKLAPFRASIALCIGSVAVAIVVASRRAFLASALCAVGLIGVGVLTAIWAPDWTDQTVRFLSSAVEEANNRTGSMEYRATWEISKLQDVWERGSLSDVAFGIGYLHRDSRAAQATGYSSEATDSGWVEILLTGGIAAAAAVAALLGATCFSYYRSYTRKGDLGDLRCLAMWIMAAGLIVTSNALLWDARFVPLALLSIAASNPRAVGPNRNKNYAFARHQPQPAGRRRPKGNLLPAQLFGSPRGASRPVPASWRTS
jgi:hypothetical protein